MLREWRGQGTSNGHLSTAGKAAYKSRLHAFIKAKQGLTKVKKARLCLPRLASKHHMLARDHALLRGAGLSLSHFKASQPVLPLQAHEVMFFKSVGDLLEEIQEAAQDRGVRVCIYDKKSRSSRLLVHWSEPRLSLCFMDQGTIGWPSNYYLLLHERLRG